MARKIIKPEWESWDQLRVFGTSRLVQATIIMPIIGYVILFNDQLAIYFRLFVDSDSGPDIPWRLYFLYFGFCFLSAGSIIFGIKCPREVKHHGAAYIFIKNEAGIMHDTREAGMREMILRRYYQHTFADRGFDYASACEANVDGANVGEDLAMIRRAMQSVVSELSKGSLEETMREYFQLLEESLPRWRRTTYLCYAAGLALLAVPTAHTFYRIAVSMGEKLLGH